MGAKCRLPSPQCAVTWSRPTIGRGLMRTLSHFVMTSSASSSGPRRSVRLIPTLSVINKENFDTHEDEDSEEAGSKSVSSSSVSPYSYSSFLSEVYSVTLRKMKYKVEL